MNDLLTDDGVIRKLWLFETNSYRDHLLRLDSASRHSRFGGAVSDDYIRAHTKDLNHLDAVLHGFFVDGVLRGAAELRQIGPRSRREAEAAFSIEQPWQSHGVGSALLERTLLAARNRGVRLLHMDCVAHNKRMQQLARKFDAELKFDFGTVVGEVQAARATPLSVIREAVADWNGWAETLLDAQARMLRPR